jgi:hypothetical protein
MTDSKKQRAKRNAALFGFGKQDEPLPEAPNPSAEDKRLERILDLLGLEVKKK